MTVLAYPTASLATDGVVLRPWAESDLDDAHRATLDPLIPRFTRVPLDNSREDVQRHFESHEAARLAGEELHFAIADTASNRFLGTSSLLRIDWDDSRAEIGYWLAPWARGRGAATDSVTLLSRWALANLPLARLELRIDPDNQASLSVADRAGFRREGVLRSFEERKGQRHDIIVCSLLATDLG